MAPARSRLVHAIGAIGALVALVAAEDARACLLPFPWFETQWYCAGQPARFDASVLNVGDCAGPTEYRFSDGSTFRDWLADPVLAWTPTVDTVLLVETRCSTEPSCGGQTPAEIRVIPDGVPESLGNTLRARRSADLVGLHWDESLASSYFRVRSATARDFAASRVDLETDNLYALAALDPPPGGACRYFRVTGVGCSGDEGP